MQVKNVEDEIERHKTLVAEAAAAGEVYDVPKHVEAEILQRLTGTEKKRGCIVPGMGGEYARPPKPRGGARTSKASDEAIVAAVAASRAEMEELARVREASVQEEIAALNRRLNEQQA